MTMHRFRTILVSEVQMVEMHIEKLTIISQIWFNSREERIFVRQYPKAVIAAIAS
jgi:hypothetical protein